MSSAHFSTEPLSDTRPYLPGDRHDACISKDRRRQNCGLRDNDRFLAVDREPPLGAHLVTPRRGYAHHGIYVGGGTVVHYGALARRRHRGPVEEISLAEFAGGHSVWIRSGKAPRFDCNEVIRRARSRLGEDCYRILTNNCEHFCEWCLHGRQRSYQVEELLSQPLRALQATIGIVATLFAVHSGFS